MTECQGCGAWNNAERTLCVLCGTPLAETDEWDTEADPPPLPPLPDGGLSASMPAWLRELPGAHPAAADPPAAPTSPGETVAVAAVPTREPLGPRADPRTFLTDDDFPRWLRDLAAREALRAAPAPAASPAASPPNQPAAPEWPVWPAGSIRTLTLNEAPAATAEPVVPAPASAIERHPSPAVATARAGEERRARSLWETLLLVILFIGVVVAALWALAANGVFSPAL